MTAHPAAGVTLLGIGAAAAAHWHGLLAAQRGGALPLAAALDLPALLQALAPLQPAIAARLGATPWCIASQCWVRRAMPPHSWHQDGALLHDFIAHPQPQPDALLAMVTCWIALTPCGGDAPGLEWLDAPLAALLPAAALDDGALRRHFPAAAFVQPQLAAGDALLFDGSLLHRTHHTAAMTRPRTSIELRFCARPAPPRLAGERLLHFGGDRAAVQSVDAAVVPTIGLAAPDATNPSTSVPPG